MRIITFMINFCENYIMFTGPRCATWTQRNNNSNIINIWFKYYKHMVQKIMVIEFKNYEPYSFVLTSAARWPYSLKNINIEKMFVIFKS